MSFTWVPFYREVAERVLDYENRQDELVQVLRAIEADGADTMFLTENQADGKMTELSAIDPFTFLANFSRTGDEKAERACHALEKHWDLQEPSPVFFYGRVKVSAINPWFFSSVGDGRAPDDIAKLWDLARAVLQGRELDAALFARCLQIRGVGASKLTTGLFWLDPARYLATSNPIVSYLERQGVNCNRKLLEKGDFAEYQSWLQAARAHNDYFPDLSHGAWTDRKVVSATAPNTEDEIIETVMPDFSLNQILYGPPGTGKTYSTVERAVEIIDGVPASSHGEAKARFDALRKAGQIEFVTFHQSFSYEEFIEGLRPILDEDGDGQARYEVRAGVLKKLAVRATEAAPKANEELRLKFGQVWKMFLNQIQDSNFIAGLGTGEYEIQVTATHVVGENVAGKANRNYKVPLRILEKIWPILQPEQKPTSIAIRTIYGDGQPKGFDCNLGGAVLQALQKIQKDALNLTEAKPDFRNANRYVLIVDEINRGNISKILGELITLLEPDKRLGAANELRVQLPVSGESFALPPNLYLLGTMNTADKSLALLDIALRRRFDFLEMAPDAALFPVYAREVLVQLNWRLEVALDREHRIGHAYFVGRNEGEFNAIFRAKIIPLLQEFFYNDWETLRAVLGESGDKDGAFIKKLAAPAGMKARTKWRWWFDAAGARDFDFLETLRGNYADL